MVSYKDFCIVFLVAACSIVGAVPSEAQQTEPCGIRMVTIPSGEFWMGSNGKGADYDEYPVHKVKITRSFRMSAMEITNAQYEMFDPSHRELRGKQGFSLADDEAVIFVSWHDAMNFCRWLSEKTGKTWRLPTEAEWEYACRAGTYTHFHYGDKFPAKAHKNQAEHHSFIPVDLSVGRTVPNAFGLYDMHGNVEEWCHDWYGPYQGGEADDPVGYSDGYYKITRGGSHSTLTEFLRSANRMAMIPEDRHYLTGFRVVEGELPDTEYLVQDASEYKGDDVINGNKDVVKTKGSRGGKVSQKNAEWAQSGKGEPVFMEPVVYINPPQAAAPGKAPLYPHNHCPAVTWCKNGDLIAVWFSTVSEFGREMSVWTSRLKCGSPEWSAAKLFCKVPDRNMTGSSLYCDSETGRLYFLNGVEAGSWWRNLALMMRTSDDNGKTWSRPRIVSAEHDTGHQVIAGMVRTKEGWLLNVCDGGPDNNEGSVIQISKDGGQSFMSPCGERPVEFRAGEKGGMIAGIHACTVQLNDGSLMAFGRGNDVRNEEGRKRMTCSISRDMGKTWEYQASPFPPISGGQRCTMIRLQEGPILLVSFTHHPLRVPADKERMLIDGKMKSGIFAALSYDEGRTWPVVKLISDGKYRFMDGGAWTGFFEMDEDRSEPRGYLTMTQSPDGMIHLLSSRNHYRFNLQWLETH